MMQEKQRKGGKSKETPLVISVVLVFCILGAVVFFISQKISSEISSSAVNNLSESLDLIQGTIESILNNEADFQKLIAQEIMMLEDPEEFIRSYSKNKTLARLSLIRSGEHEGISNTGEKFSETGLDFSAGKEVEGLPISSSYLNDMGTWAYTMKCPVVKDDEEIATLYAEYIYDLLDETLPNSFYGGHAMLYIMDTKNERFVLTPKGMGERNAGHLDLADFYRANDILDEELQAEVSEAVSSGQNFMFYHDVLKKDSLIYMWSVNHGAIYLIGYVPIEAIQQESASVTQNIYIMVVSMMAAFLLCCILYYFKQKQQDKIRKEREEEREVHSRQLAEALQTAQIANSSKTMFLSNMSHDIRTPMNAILGFTTLLTRDAENPEKVREYTEKIAASGRHLLGLINDVLDVSKIESGKVVLTIGEFALKDLVSSVDSIIRPMAHAKNQHFEVSVTDIEHEYLIGDETRLNQVLINLLSNSVKYTPEKGIIWLRIIRLKQHTSQYEHIRIEVEDNGYGMTPEYLKTIFDPFTRAENSTTHKVQGTGLGMAITKNIVELMGGTIRVASEVDKGTLFTVELELRVPDGQTDEEFWKNYSISRILAVDDDVEICKNVQTLMRNTGVLVDTTFRGKEAVRMVQDAIASGKDYQMILLDYQMPGLNGIETAKQIRALVPWEIPILFLTAYDGQELEEEAGSIGNFGVLAKPFFVAAFKEKIMKMHAERHPEDGMPEPAEDHDLEGLHFLVAEDNEINAEILSELLELEGATCEVVENGQLAVNRFKASTAGEFDAILMDVQMPVMNGYEASRAIRAMERKDAGEIPIIAMTANAFAEDVKDSLDAGMNVHIAKPIDMELLKKTVDHYIRRKEPL